MASNLNDNMHKQKQNMPVKQTADGVHDKYAVFQ